MINILLQSFFIIICNMKHWRRKWQPTPVSLPRKPHGQYQKDKRYDAGR